MRWALCPLSPHSVANAGPCQILSGSSQQRQQHCRQNRPPAVTLHGSSSSKRFSAMKASVLFAALIGAVINASGTSAQDAQSYYGFGTADSSQAQWPNATGLQRPPAAVIVSPPSVDMWTPESSDLSAEEVKSLLSKSGWGSMAINEKLPHAPTFNVYSSSPQPGLISYFVVPKGSNQAPVEFRAAGTFSGPALQATEASWFKDKTEQAVEAVRATIKDATQITIAELCSMDKPPREFTLKASAAGIVEFEGTWLSSDACE